MAPWRWRLANVLGLMTHTNRIIRGRWIVGAAVIAVLAGACGGGGSSGGGSSGGGGGSASGGQVDEPPGDRSRHLAQGQRCRRARRRRAGRRRLDHRHLRPEGRYVHVLLLG